MRDSIYKGMGKYGAYFTIAALPTLFGCAGGSVRQEVSKPYQVSPLKDLQMGKYKIIGPNDDKDAYETLKQIILSKYLDENAKKFAGTYGTYLLFVATKNPKELAAFVLVDDGDGQAWIKSGKDEQGTEHKADAVAIDLETIAASDTTSAEPEKTTPIHAHIVPKGDIAPSHWRYLGF